MINAAGSRGGEWCEVLFVLIVRWTNLGIEFYKELSGFEYVL